MFDDDPRITGIGLFTFNGNFDADSSGPVWGEWIIVPEGVLAGTITE